MRHLCLFVWFPPFVAAATRYLKISEAKTPFATTSSLQGMRKMLGPAPKQLVASFLLACVQVAAIAWELRWCSDPMYSFIACRSSCSACRLCSTMRPLGFAVAGGWIPSASWMRDIYSALADHSAHFFNRFVFFIFCLSSDHPSCNHPFSDT